MIGNGGVYFYICFFFSSFSEAYEMSRFDFAKAIEELQQLRTTNERSSERITNLGQRIIDDNYTSKLGDQGKM
jgi:hypothetical protein